MAGDIRLFEKNASGLLVQVAPDQADAIRSGRRVSRMAMEIDVLWTAEEEAAHDVEEAAEAEARRQAAERTEREQVEAEQRRSAAEAKLAALGLTADDIAALRI